MPRKTADEWEPEAERKRHRVAWGRSPRPMVLVGLVLAVLAASLGVSLLVEGIRSVADLRGPHQQWRGVVIEHTESNLLFTGIVVRHSLVVGFIDLHNPAATFTVNVDEQTFDAVPDGILISLDLGPRTGHVYGFSTSQDGVAWQNHPLDPGGNQLRLLSWLLLPSGGVLALLGLLGLVMVIWGLADLLAGTRVVSGFVVDVLEGTFFRLPCVVIEQGNGTLVLLALRSSLYEKVCEDGGRSQMTFVVSRLLGHVRRGRRRRASEALSLPLEKGQQRRQDKGLPRASGSTNGW
jgi:hypothetical protein